MCLSLEGWLICEVLQVVEVYNFDQDDLMTEDIYILDNHSEIYVWVGQQVDSKSRLHALTIGEVRVMYLQHSFVNLVSSRQPTSHAIFR